MTRFLMRFIGAFFLVPATYEDVEAHQDALPQAVIVVVASSLATGIPYYADTGLRGLFGGLLGALLGWLCWSWLAFHIGVRWLPEENTRADWGQLLRTTGFATAPAVLRVAGVVAEARDPVLALTTVWMLAAFVIAVRQALDYSSTLRALGVCVLGWVLYGGLLFLAPRACQLVAG